MTASVTPLTPAQGTALAILAGAGTAQAAATEAGVSLRTIRRWLATPGYRQHLTTATAATVAEARERLAATATQAVATLADVMADPSAPAAARVSAARVILAAALDRDVDDRLTRLEEALSA
ncbi:MAG TPA: hypothetical protein P5193_00995 [Microthrixaceae bacterium]|nr:hypothetical protein [Microthrixaceae bacterium]